MSSKDRTVSLKVKLLLWLTKLRTFSSRKYRGRYRSQKLKYAITCTVATCEQVASKVQAALCVLLVQCAVIGAAAQFSFM